MVLCCSRLLLKTEGSHASSQRKLAKKNAGYSEHCTEPLGSRELPRKSTTHRLTRLLPSEEEYLRERQPAARLAWIDNIHIARDRGDAKNARHYQRVPYDNMNTVPIKPEPALKNGQKSGRVSGTCRSDHQLTVLHGDTRAWIIIHAHLALLVAQLIGHVVSQRLGMSVVHRFTMGSHGRFGT